MARIIETTIDSLVPDSRNFNKGTEFGGHLIEKSLREFGAGRSILLDKNNNIIAGNKTTENCANIGLDKVIVVETSGDELVAVKRKDIDINSRRGRELALADNATAAANLSWEQPVLMDAAEQFDIDLDGWGVHIDDDSQSGNEGEQPESGEKHIVMVECATSGEQETLYYELQGRGFKAFIK